MYHKSLVPKAKKSSYRLDKKWLLELNRNKDTFLIVHQNAMPTKDVSTKGNLWCNEFTFHTNWASNKLFDPKLNKSNLLPLMSFGKPQIADFLISGMREINNTSQFGP